MNKSDLTIFEQGWPSDDTICGWGSKMEHTENIRKMLPIIIRTLEVKKVNDAGCGDLFWIKTLDLRDIDYVGYDLYERSSWYNLRKDGWDLKTINIIDEDMRKCDLIICRDVFIHLPNNLILKALDRFKSVSKYLLTTNFLSPKEENATEENKKYIFSNFDRISQTDMHHSKLDLRLPPFNLGNPITMIPEDYPYKNISLWSLEK